MALDAGIRVPSTSRPARLSSTLRKDRNGYLTHPFGHSCRVTANLLLKAFRLDEKPSEALLQSPLTPSITHVACRAPARSDVARSRATLDLLDTGARSSPRAPRTGSKRWEQHRP